jgi:transcriptional regulator with XRE-family HTH domain
MKDHSIKPDNMTEQELSDIVSRTVYLQERLGLSQNGFAKTIHVSQPYLSKIESGKMPVTKDFTRSVIAYTGVDAAWYLYGIGSKEDAVPSADEARENFRAIKSGELLSELSQLYSLDDTDIKLIQNFISMSEEERKSLSSALNSLLAR